MRFLPPAGAPRLLASAQLTNAVGDGAYLACSVLYFTRIVGLSATQVALGLTLGWGVGFLTGVPLGHLADRRGLRGTAVLLAIGTSLSVAGFLVSRSFATFVLLNCLYATAQGGLAAVRQALLASLVDSAERTRVRAHLQSAANAGLALGAAAGGLALTAGTRQAYLGAFALDALSFLAAAGLLSRLPAVPPVPPERGAPKLAVLRDRPYALLSLLNMVMLLRMPLISLATPLWIVQRTHAPQWTVSALLLLNTLAVMAFQVRVARRVSGLGSAARIVRRSGVVLLAACAGYALSGFAGSAAAASGALIAASAVLVIGEMMQSAGAWEISFDLAPPHQQGQYQGFFGTGVAVVRMIGPLLLTTLITGWGTAGWLLLGGLFLLSGLATGPAVRWATRDGRRWQPTAATVHSGPVPCPA